MRTIGNRVRNELLFETKKEFKLFLATILVPSIVGIFVVYIIINFADPDQSLSYNSFPTAGILSIGSIVLIKILFYSHLEKHEIKILAAASLFLVITFVAELIYVYQQFFLGIAVPYPSVADILYLSANVFLSYHLYSTLVSLKREKNQKLSTIVLVNVLISIIPIYITLNIIINSGMSLIGDTIPFVTDLSYYVFDLLMLAPSIFIVLNLNKNNPIIFHWLLICLGIFFLTVADLGYTYSAQVSEELITQTHTVWNVLYGISYILLITGIFWYGKIKRILYDKEVDSIINNVQVVYKGLEREIDRNNSNDNIEFNEDIKGSKDIIKTLKEVVQKTERDIDILLTNKSILDINKIDEFFYFMIAVTNKKNNPNIRILAPLSENRNLHEIVGTKNDQIQIQDFEHSINFNAIVILLDKKFLFVIDIENNSTNIENFNKAKFTNEPANVLVYVNLFERIWLTVISNSVS